MAGWLWMAAGLGGEANASPMNGNTGVNAADSARQSTYMVVEDMPKFLGGDLTQWLAKNTKYPEAALKRKAEGRVFVQFIIEKDGRVTNVKVLRPVDPDLDREAVRVVSSMPRWKPGRQRGKFVRVSYTVPINFQLTRGKGKAGTEPDKDAYVVTGNRMTQPFFPGDWDEWVKNRRLKEEKNYPGNFQGNVTVSFMVEPDGSVSHARIRLGLQKEVNEAALRIVRSMPKWTPGTINGKPTRMEWRVNVPIRQHYSYAKDSIYMIVDEMPKFTEKDLTLWLAKNIRYKEMGCGFAPRLFVQFVIEKDGSVTNARVLRPIDPALDKEGIRVVESMPRWIPGKHNGKPVRVLYTVPINFQLQ